MPTAEDQHLRLSAASQNTQDVKNQAACPRLRICCATFLTTSKCGRPKKTECLLDQELELMINVETWISSFRRPLCLPLVLVSLAAKGYRGT